MVKTKQLKRHEHPGREADRVMAFTRSALAGPRAYSRMIEVLVRAGFRAKAGLLAEPVECIVLEGGDVIWRQWDA